MGIGSLGWYWSGIIYIKILKNREYVVWGILFVYLEIDVDFDYCNYVFKVLVNEILINIYELIFFYYS